MKKNVILLSIINIIALSINLLFNFSFENYIFHLAFILLLLDITLNKNLILLFLIILLPSNLMLIILLDNFNIAYLIFIVILIINYIYSFKYVLKIHNNKLNIAFKNIKIPDDKEYLVVNYIHGPLKGGNIKGIVIKEKDYFKIIIERKDETTEDFNINFNSIDSVVVNKKPYMRKGASFNDYLPHLFDGTESTHMYYEAEVYPDFKIISSYEININIKDDTVIELISFNNPSIFDL